MSEIDRKRISAVRQLEATGYVFENGLWVGPAAPQVVWPPADRLHALLMRRADELAGCIEGSAQEDELKAIRDALQGYEAVRWPDGKA